MIKSIISFSLPKNVTNFISHLKLGDERCSTDKHSPIKGCLSDRGRYKTTSSVCTELKLVSHRWHIVFWASVRTDLVFYLGRAGPITFPGSRVVVVVACICESEKTAFLYYHVMFPGWPAIDLWFSSSLFHSQRSCHPLTYYEISCLSPGNMQIIQNEGPLNNHRSCFSVHSEKQQKWGRGKMMFVAVLQFVPIVRRTERLINHFSHNGPWVM